MIFKFRTALTALLLSASVTSFAEPPPVQDPSSPEVGKAALLGGVPRGRWKDGVLFEGISPQPWRPCCCLHR